jgi:hypothetical protein
MLLAPTLSTACKNAALLAGQTVLLAVDANGFAASDRMIVEDVYVDNANQLIYLTVVPEDTRDSLSDPDPFSLEAICFTTVTGCPMPTKAIEEDGELSIPMTQIQDSLAPLPIPAAPLQPVPVDASNDSQTVVAEASAPVIAGPAYQHNGSNPVDAIFETYAPAHSVSEEFKKSYKMFNHTDPAALQLELQAQQLLTSNWTVEQTAQMYANMLKGRSLHVPEEVTAILVEAAKKRQAAEEAQRAAEAARILQSPARVAAPEADTTEASNDEATDGNSDKRPGRRGRPPKATVAEVPAPTTDKVETAVNSTSIKLSNSQLAAVSALLTVHLADPEHFEENVSVAMDAIRALL